MRVKRTKSKCGVCPLQPCNRVWGFSEIPNPTIAVIGEAPGEQEDEEVDERGKLINKPFIGPAGRYLSYLLAQSGIVRRNVYLTNVVSCRPPDNEIDGLDGREAVKNCAPGLREELEKIVASGVRTIIALGNPAMRSLGIEGGITKNRGSVYQLLVGGKRVNVVPSFHPSHLLRGEKRQEPTVIQDLKKALSISIHGWAPPKEDFEMFPTIKWLEKKVDSILGKRKKPLLAVDIETAGGKIYLVGIALSATEAFSVPFYSRNWAPYWTHNGDDNYARKLLGRLLEGCPTLFQNAPFDVSWLMDEGFKFGDIHDDVLLAHHAIHPELPHNLGYIVSIYGATPYWKEGVLSNIQSIPYQEDEDLRVYNLRDAAVLHQVLPDLMLDLEATGTMHIYRGISMPLVPIVVEMQRTGMKLDKVRHTKYVRDLKTRNTRLYNQLVKVLELPEGFNFQSSLHMAKLVYGKEPNNMEAKRKALLSYDEEGTRKHKTTKAYAELKSYVDAIEGVQPLQSTKAAIRKTDGGQLATNTVALLAIKISTNNMLHEIETLKRPTPFHKGRKRALERNAAFFKLFFEFRTTSTLLKTFSKFRIGSDGKVHPSFMVHGTNTGRLSSRRPNWQNIPPVARYLFRPPEGWMFTQADFSNIELRVLSFESNDKELQRLFKEGIDVHGQNAKDLFEGVDENHPMWTVFRKAEKIYIFGRSYGGGTYGIYTRMMIKVPEFNLTYAQFVEADQRYFAKHPAYAKWYEETCDTVDKTRTIVTVMGRKRFFLGGDAEVRREALDTRIQSPAADIKNKAAIRIFKRIRAEGLEALFVNDIHDALVLEHPIEERQAVHKIMKEEMERPLKLWGKTVVFPVAFSSSADSWGALGDEEEAELMYDEEENDAEREST